MKHFLSLLVVSVLLTSGALAAVVSYTNSGTVAGNNSFADLSLNKFDTGLGTLTGITVTVNFTTLDGSFSVTADTATPVDVNAAEARVTIRQALTNSLGFTQLGATSFTPIYTPSIPLTIPGNSSQTFTLTSTNVFVNQSQSIATNYWSAYESVGGVGQVTFQFKQNPLIDAGGGTYAVNSLNYTASPNMSVTYTYDAGPSPVPEPSTVMAGGLLVLIGAGTYLRRKRKSARA